MSFNFMLKASAAKPQQLLVRKEVVTTKSAVPRENLLSAPPRTDLRRPQPKKVDRNPRKSTPQSSSETERRVPRKRSTPTQRTVFSSDDSDADDVLERPSKKMKQESVQDTDSKRQIWSAKAFSGDDEGLFPMVHAAEITSLDKATKYLPTFEGWSDSLEVVLQYPSVSQRERHSLSTHNAAHHC